MSLRVQTVSQNHESRPSPRDTKKFGFINRWASLGIYRHSLHNQNSDNMHCSHQQNRIRTDSNNSATSIETSSSYASQNMVSIAHLGATESKFYNSSAIQINESSIDKMAVYNERRHASLPSASILSFGVPNVMQWMQSDCPKDVVPSILAFAGPQKVATIGKTNRFWRQVMEQEETWSRLCESLYKWREGDDIPQSWKKYYQYNPCVPVDYSSIHSAINETTTTAQRDSSKPGAVRVLLRAGRYNLRKAITIDGKDTNPNDIYSNHSVSVSIETMTYSPGHCRNGDLGLHSMEPHLPSGQSRKKLKTSIKNIFRCRTVDVENEDEDNFDHHDSFDESLENSILPSDGSVTSGDRGINRATLVLTSRRHNEPLLRVDYGSFTLRNINLIHGSSGNDIWNGNSAIQIQPRVISDTEPVYVPAPTVTLDCVDVTSWSGRGIVSVDGGHLKINNSYIHDCAATGIYIGGSGSRATIEHSDVIFNGKGNRKTRRGIAAGHSGIYLEQGDASIIDCNISRNSLTGISAISPDNAVMTLKESDLFSNGTFQLEMPGFGSAAYRNSVTTDNTLASSGTGRSRSVLYVG